ncbi:MAG: DNA helicase II [Gammaproteobacteria bacterium]|nr:DNA helicase II [Gammaproteobacteria bacterium]
MAAHRFIWNSNLNPITASLNSKQAEAVTAPNQHMLVLAGAGSGKTRVLVHRLAWLFEHENISPFRVLAVTFTNKAAGALRSRIEDLFHCSTQGMWIGTFHGIAHRLLRMHYEQAGLPQTFQILDSDDQYRQIRRVLKSLNIDEAQWPPKESQRFINNQKDQGLRPGQISGYQDPNKAMQVKIYDAYERLCAQNQVIDFAELLLRAYDLWHKNPALLKEYRQRFQHILVDEFQDTNTIQYAWLKMLVDENNVMMAVGDDDQSIYGWRGAQIENIHRFQHDFPNVKTVRLEQNYRSTKTILAAANAVISHNTDRLGKELWTDGEAGTPILLYAAFNELDEARFIVSRIQQAIEQNYKRDEIAILYRSNAQSRVLEEALIHAGVPYRIYGGLRFFERAEIKIALAYLRLLVTPEDDPAFERIVNVPARGLGDKTLDSIRELAKQNQCPLWQASKIMLEQNLLPGRAANALGLFVNLIETMAASVKDLPLKEQFEQVLQASGLIELYENDRDEKNEGRLENLAELVTAASQYAPEQLDNMTPLSAFLAHAVLESGEAQAEAYETCVQLMTLHSSKGLEFPLVFIAGMEDELFPARASMEDHKRLEEERRLCYVGMTRAMRRLVITYSEYRRLYGENKMHTPSRFLREIPKTCLEEVRMKTSITSPVSLQSGNERRFISSAPGLKSDDGVWHVGQMVAHDKFGEGVIINYEGTGPQARVQVKFKTTGIKWLVAAYANLKAGA